MPDRIHIQMMDSFAIYINDKLRDQMLNKSRKGLALMQYLILHGGQPVSNYRLLTTFWSEDKSSNPENALKTLISRMRTMLNQFYDGLGNCIVADRGAYHWESLPEMTIDVFEIDAILDLLPKCKDDLEESGKLMRRMMSLYKGDLLANSENNEWAVSRATTLHNKYMAAVFSFLEMLKHAERHEEIIQVCRAALEVDNFDDHLHLELMSALIKTNRNNEALLQYKHVMHLHYRYLGIQPSEDIQEFYKQIVNAGKTLEFNLESIRNELRESGEQRGIFVCEYAVFKEIYNLQMRNLERLGSTMFLAVIMVTNINGQPMDSIKQENIMSGLLDILKKNLRKGDTVTHFNPTILALLLPTVNYNTGSIVMERIKRLFYQKYPNSNVSFNYRVGPLSSDMKPISKQTEVGNEGERPQLPAE